MNREKEWQKKTVVRGEWRENEMTKKRDEIKKESGGMVLCGGGLVKNRVSAS